MKYKIIKLMAMVVIVPIVAVFLVTLRDPEDILRRKNSFGTAFAWQSLAWVCPLNPSQSLLRPRAAAEKRPGKANKSLSNMTKPSDEFIESILTDKAREAGINDKQRERIRQLIIYFWEHEGWACAEELTQHLAEYRRYVGWTKEAILHDLGLDLVDFDKFRQESIGRKKPTPLFFTYKKEKKRILRVIEICERMGWRASLTELCKVLGLSERKRKGVSMVFPNCRNRGQLKIFMEMLNYNRALNKKLSIQIFVNSYKKQLQDALIRAVEAFGGRASYEDVEGLLGWKRYLISRVNNSIDFNDLNKKRRTQELIPIFGIIFEKTKRVQDEIIAALEKRGGVALAEEVIKLGGSDKTSARVVMAQMDFGLINEIRVKMGLMPLFVIRQDRRDNLKNILGDRIIQRGSDAQMTIDTMRIWYRRKFGKAGRSDFETVTAPFAYMVVYGNNKGLVKQDRSAIKAERRNNIFQRVLEVVINHAQRKGLFTAERVTEGNVPKNAALNTYFKVAVPRALNINRAILANVDVSKINPLAYGGKNTGSKTKENLMPMVNAIRPEEEMHIKMFLEDLDRILQEMAGLQRAISYSNGTIIFNKDKRIARARGQYNAIKKREKNRLARLKKAFQVPILRTGPDRVVVTGVMPKAVTAADSSILRPRAAQERDMSREVPPRCRAPIEHAPRREASEARADSLIWQASGRSALRTTHLPRLTEDGFLQIMSSILRPRSVLDRPGQKFRVIRN